jgi:hypothetical protein
MGMVKHPHQAKQEYFDTRPLTLIKLSAKLPE